MDVKFYTFKKKHNSTKQPSQGAGTNYSCTLIEGCSIIEPVIKVIAPAGTDVTKYNYAYIPAFDRYYFVTNITYDITTFSIHLSCDRMASAKTTIGASSHYIERSSFTFDGDVIDSVYPTKTGMTKVIAKPAKVGQVYPTIFGSTISPSYIVGIIGGIASENVDKIGKCYNGSVVYFSLRQDQLGPFIGKLLDSVSLYDIPITELSANLQKQLINPIQYIHSIKCVPFTPNTSGQDPNGYVAKHFLCGFNYVDVPGYDDEQDPQSWAICKAPTIGELTIDNGYMEKRSTMINIPLHPEYSSRGHWMLGQPCSKYIFEAQPFGQIEIPSGVILSAPISTPVSGDPYIILYVTTVFDISTGECTLFLGFNQNVDEAFYSVTKNCAVSVPVHQAVQDVMAHRQARRDLIFQQIGAVKSFFNAGKGMLAGAETVEGASAPGGASVGSMKSGDAIDTATHYMQKMMNTVDDATMANQVSISGNGNEGSYMSFNKDITVPRVVCYFTPLVEEENSERGRPLCQVKQISTIPGFILTSGANIETNLTASENADICNIMNGGFYYE